MKIKLIVLLFALLSASMLLWAQSPAPPPGTPRRVEKNIVVRKGFPMGGTVAVHGGMGKWWRDAEISKKLQLSDGQIAQLDQIFYDHRVKLIDYGAEMEKQDLKLQTLLDADTPNEGEIGSQVDLVLSARSKLEREYTFMNLDLRKVLSLDQWRQLKSIRGDHEGGDVIFFHKKLGPGAGPMTAPLPPEFGELPPPPAEPEL